MRLKPWALAPAFIVLSLAWPSAQTVSLRTVMERTANYIRDFENQLGGIVAEELYLQEVVPPQYSGAAVTVNAPGRSSRIETPIQRQYRELRSDILLVRPLGAGGWIQFRDVFAMDGILVRDRTDRLANLFLKPSNTTAAQARRIQEESARYNIGNLERTVNVPMLPLPFLDVDLQPRFEFTRVLDTPAGGDKPAVPRNVPEGPNFAVPANAMEIQFRETQAGTLIRTTASRDLPAHGRFWIDPDRGRVLMSELILDDPFVFGTVHVAYKPNSDFDLLVPMEMREFYALRTTGYRIYGTATYSKFRRFQVTVDETITPVK
jgi:hypothetical protein